MAAPAQYAAPDASASTASIVVGVNHAGATSCPTVTMYSQLDAVRVAATLRVVIAGPVATLSEPPADRRHRGAQPFGHMSR
jgi:hypothetical protein